MIVVRVVDTTNLSSAASVTVYYAPPVSISITSPSDGSTINSDRVTVRGTVADAEMSVVVNGVFASVQTGEFTAYGIGLQEGENEISAMVWHPGYEVVVGTDTASIHTVEARQPVKIQPSATHGIPPAGVDFSLAVDTDNPIVNYKWDLDSDGIWEIDSTDQDTASTSYDEARIYNPRVLVTDSQGVSFMDRVSINVHNPAQVLGSFGSGSPSDIVRTPDRNFLVLDSAACTVTEYDADGMTTGFQSGSCGSGDGEFQSPMALALGPTGAIYVADTGNDRVQKFDSQGNFILAFSDWVCGPSVGPLEQPYGIAVDSFHRVYVIDRGNGRMMSFDHDFCDCALATPTGLLDDPRRVKVDGRGYIYFVGNGFYDQNKGSINIYRTSGQYLMTLNADTGLPLTEPDDLLAENGRIYIADRGAGSILVLDDDFQNLRVENEAPGVASAPAALAAGMRAAQDTFLAADAGAVVEAELPGDTPEAVWYAMKAELAAGHFQEALEYFIESSRARYEHTFTVLAGQIPAVAAAWGSITPEVIYGDTATYVFEQEETWNGVPQTVPHSIQFVRDENGL